MNERSAFVVRLVDQCLVHLNCDVRFDVGDSNNIGAVSMGHRLNSDFINVFILGYV